MTKKTLPHGTLKKLAGEFNLSSSTIKNMLDGKYLHARQVEIFKRAAEIKTEYYKKLEEIKTLQSSLTNH